MKHLLRPLSFTSFFVFCAFLLTGSALLPTSSAFAQGPPLWTPVTPTPFTGTEIHIVKFLDYLPIPAPNTGVLSDGPEIWHTTTGGLTPASWSLATISSPHGTLVPFATGWVNDISFKDASTGFAIITGNANLQDSGVLKTTDGGGSWTFIDSPGTPDSGCGIYYNSSNNLLFVSSLDKGFVVSSNEGATWDLIDSAKYYTGFAFTSGARGVLATQGSNSDGFNPSNHWRYTTDGGMTWDTARMFYECWQPAGIPTTETFYGSTNEFTNLTTAIMRSDNNGYAFAPLVGYQNSADVLTQAMQGDGCSLFASSNNLNFGMWISVNDGLSWNAMQGAPNPGVDTRFYVSPTTIWSFSVDTLKHTARLGSAEIHIWPDTINFTNAGCEVPTDTVVHIFGCDCANKDSLLSGSVTRLVQLTLPDTISVDAGTPLPRPLCSSSSAPLGNPDFVTIHYEPKNANSEDADIHLHFSEDGGSKLVDTIVHITGNGATTSLVVPKKRIALSAPACGGQVDTCFDISNTGCIPIRITSCNVTEDNGCILWFDDCPQNLVLDPSVNPTQPFCVHFLPSLQQGTTNATISFNWVATDGSQNGTTSLISATGITTTTIQPSFRGFTIGSPPDRARSCCDIPSDTTIYFINTTCDTLTMEAPNFFGASDPNMFTLVPVKPPLIFPEKLAPNQFIPLKIHIACREGTFSTKVQFIYTVGTSGGNCSNFLTASDTAVLKLTSTADITPAAIKPNSVNFIVSCCDSTQTKTFTIQPGCRLDTLTGLALNNSAGGNFYIVPPPPTPPVQLPQTITIGFLPRSSNGATVNGSIGFTLSDGTTLNLGISGKCTSLPAAALSTGEINFDSLLTCGPSRCDTMWIKNSSCDPIKINSILGPNTPFTLESPAVGTQLGIGDSAEVVVCLDPATARNTGNLSDMIVFIITDPTGNIVGVSDTVSLQGYLVPPVVSNTVTQLATATICDTDTLDEQFTFTNTGQCYTYVFTGANTRSGEVSISPQTARVPVGTAQTFTVHFAPGGVPGNLTDSIMLTDSAGNSIEVPYNITVNSCTSTGHLTVTMPGSTITTPNCTQGTLAFSVGAGGGAGTVTGVTVTGSTRFTTPNSSGGPMPFNGTVTFDPNLVGGNTATLTISYTINGQSGDTTITLTGVVSGSKFKASVDVVSETNGPVKPDKVMLKDFEVVLADTVFDSLAMNKLSLLIRFDGDLLWLPNFTTDPAWSVDAVHTYQDKQGLHLVLLYNGSAKHYTGANDTIVKVTFLAAVSDSNATVAYADSAHFNDSTFEACTLKALNGSGTAPFSIDTACSTAIMERALPDNLQPYSGIEVIPDPAHKDGGAATLHFTTSVSAPMTVDVLNVLGNSVAQLANGPVTKGDHALSIPTNDMAEGAYFVRISMNGFTVVRKFVLEKE